MTKVSVTVDDEVLRAAREIAPNGNVSALVNQALAQEVRWARMRELVREEEAEHGPIPQEVLDDVQRRWLD